MKEPLCKNGCGEPAEWPDNITDKALCQMCWEQYCADEFWKMWEGKGIAVQEAIK